MSVLNKLTEGIVNRDMKKEGEALLSKWEKTGLLEGLDNDSSKNGMARLLENQAKELLREAASTMSGGDVEGFSAVAFPIVRRVFGGLIANDLVSVQPMSLPSGLIFFLDFTFAQNKLGTGRQDLDVTSAYPAGSSLYGGGVVGSEITGGVSLTGSNAERGFYSLNNGYSSATGSSAVPATLAIADFIYGTGSGQGGVVGATQDGLNKLIRFDPDLSGSDICIIKVTGSTEGNFEQLNLDDLVSLNLTGALACGGRLVRRLTQFHSSSTNNGDPSSANFSLALVFEANQGVAGGAHGMALHLHHIGVRGGLVMGYTITDNFTSTGASLGGVLGTTLWDLENNTNLPEINIKVDSVAVTAMTKKLKAKWTPELGQDLNAYHNLDAEVELTSILSEQIALEIDQEILADLR